MGSVGGGCQNRSMADRPRRDRDDDRPPDGSRGHRAPGPRHDGGPRGRPPGHSQRPRPYDGPRRDTSRGGRRAMPAVASAGDQTTGRTDRPATTAPAPSSRIGAIEPAARPRPRRPAPGAGSAAGAGSSPGRDGRPPGGVGRWIGVRHGPRPVARIAGPADPSRPARPWVDRRPAERGRPYPAPAPGRGFAAPPAIDPLAEDEELVAGRRPVEEAFVAGRGAHRLLVTPQRRHALEQLVLHATRLRIPIVEVEGGSLTALAGFDGHQGCGARRRPAPVRLARRHPRPRDRARRAAVRPRPRLARGPPEPGDVAAQRRGRGRPRGRLPDTAPGAAHAVRDQGLGGRRRAPPARARSTTCRAPERPPLPRPAHRRGRGGRR